MVDICLVAMHKKIISNLPQNILAGLRLSAHENCYIWGRYDLKTEYNKDIFQYAYHAIQHAHFKIFHLVCQKYPLSTKFEQLTFLCIEQKVRWLVLVIQFAIMSNNQNPLIFIGTYCLVIFACASRRSWCCIPTTSSTMTVFQILHYSLMVLTCRMINFLNQM